MEVGFVLAEGFVLAGEKLERVAGWEVAGM